MNDLPPIPRLSRAVHPGEARILIVEDKLDNYVTLARLLSFAGVLPSHYEFRQSGVGILQLANAFTHLDVILLDLELPGEDGYSLLKQLRSMTTFQQTLIVAVTGHVSVEEMRKARTAGFDGFLGKPLDVGRFPGQLQNILSGQPVWERT